MEANKLKSRVNLEILSQSFITINSVLVMWLVNSPDPYSRFLAAIFGLVSQPFWFYSTYKARQWGMFISCFFFTGAWIYGIVNYLMA